MTKLFFEIDFPLIRTEPLASNPFLPIFVDTLQKDIEIGERNFLMQLVGSPQKEVSLYHDCIFDVHETLNDTKIFNRN